MKHVSQLLYKLPGPTQNQGSKGNLVTFLCRRVGQCSQQLPDVTDTAEPG